jgi:hypothetical protein
MTDDPMPSDFGTKAATIVLISELARLGCTASAARYREVLASAKPVLTPIDLGYDRGAQRRAVPESQLLGA